MLAYRRLNHLRFFYFDKYSGGKSSFGAELARPFMTLTGPVMPGCYRFNITIGGSRRIERQGFCVQA